jgi:uncharacterized protein YkwD
MLAVVRSQSRFLQLARRGVAVALAVGALACGATDADDGGENAGKGGTAPVTTSGADAQIYLDAHNAVRAAVQKPTTYSGSWSAVPPLARSDEIASSAQQWANHLRDSMGCGLMHADGSGYGENLAAGTNIGAERAVDMWSSESDTYTYSPKYAFEANTGHYTQIVWRETSELGCASAKCSGSSVVVCRYSPPGNYVGQQPY